MIQYPPNSTGTIVQSNVPATGTATTAPTYQAGEVQEVALVGSGKPAYRGVLLALNPGTGAATTVVAQITGSATKVVKVTKVSASATKATAAVYIDGQLVRSTGTIADGTAAAGTKVPLDSGFAAATVTVQGFTAPPTAGAVVGAIGNKIGFAPITGTPAAGVQAMEWDFSRNPVVLHGVTQTLDFKINGVQPAHNMLFDIEFEWTEE